MSIDRKKFFDGVRDGPFPGTLTAPQIDGMTAILDEFEREKLTDFRWLAYMLATTYHETSGTMQPVIETRQPREAANPSVDTAIKRLESAWSRGKMSWVKTPYWRKDKQGRSWLGRGLPQVTWKANYEKSEKETGVPFGTNPDLMLVMKNAVPVMFSGMIKGWFTGKKLANYFGVGEPQWRSARQIINRLESADKVAGYAKQFYSDLLAADVATQTAPVALPVPTAAPDSGEAKQLGVMGIGVTAASGLWQTLIGSGAFRAALVLGIACAVYWLILRPVLRRMSVLEGLYAHIDDLELSLLQKVRLALKGVKTLLWGRFLGLLGSAVGLLQYAQVIDLTQILPPIYGVPALVYMPIITGPVLMWITNKLRMASNTAAGQTDLAILPPSVPAPPTAPEGPEETVIEEQREPVARAKRKKHVKA